MLTAWSDKLEKTSARQQRQEHGYSSNAFKDMECLAWCKQWITDCADPEHSPLEGQNVHIDPIEINEVFQEYLLDMGDRGQSGFKLVQSFNRCFHAAMKEMKVPLCVGVASSDIHPPPPSLPPSFAGLLQSKERCVE